MTMYLGIDYGRAHIGLANAERSLANPLKSLRNSDRSEVLNQIDKYIKEYQIDTIICGLPEGNLVGEVTKFAKDLEQKTGLSVILHPETLSTKEAIAKLRQIKSSKKKLQNDHTYAAVLILEDYLESATLGL